MSNLVPAVLLIVALANVLLALALWLLGRAHQKQQQESTSRHLQHSLQRGRAAAPTDQMQALLGRSTESKTAFSSVFSHPLLRKLDDKLGISAWGLSMRQLYLLFGLAFGVFLLASTQAGLGLGALLLACYGLFATFGIWQRISKRRRTLLQQLPGFLDNMVRLITIGNSPHAAFQMAVPNVPAPLGDALQQASVMLSANPDMGLAMTQLERTWRLPEFGLLAAVFRMSVRYGGRTDLVLERVSAYIRDRQAAERELHALSAEIRLSAWVLALLPIVVGGLIMVLNAGYFLRMWQDPSGQTMILLAAALEAIGAFLLYRLARLK